MLENIDFLRSASTACFGVAIAAAVIAVTLFFLLDIREVFLIETGRARRKTVERMHSKNQKTGRLRDDTVVDLNEVGESALKSVTCAQPASDGEPGNRGGNTVQMPDAEYSPAAGVDTEKYGSASLQQTGNRASTVGTQSHDTGFAVSAATPFLREQGSRDVSTVGTAPGVPFRVKQKTLILHTDERIPV